MEYVLSLDVGTTTIRAFVYDNRGQIKAHQSDKVHLIHPKPGWVEIDPDQLWTSVIHVMSRAIKDAGLVPKDIKSIGISTQRATFITWRKSNGKAFHNFITWKDLRANDLVQEWNNSLTMRGIRVGSKILHFFTRQKKFIIGSILRLQCKLASMRLLWVLQNVPELMNAVKHDKTDVLYGTLDCWLLYKFSGEKKVHMTNISNAAATGLYDPFSMDYAHWFFPTFGIPFCIVPQVVDDAGHHFGSTEKSIFGHEIAITCVMADQSASVFGQGCFSKGSVKMSLGSGSFLDVNTGQEVHASMKGLVPLVGWKMGQDLVYLAEGAYHDTSSVILWAQSLGLFANPQETSKLAFNAPDTPVFFVPGFNGLQAPINDPTAAAGFIGITPQTKPNVLLRAILESVSFGMKQLLEVMLTEAPGSVTAEEICIDGGVANNDFVVQSIATLTNKSIKRINDVETSAFGVAFLAGLQSGIWKSPSDILQLRTNCKIFQPILEDKVILEQKYNQWVKACHRFKNWHDLENCME